MVYFTIFSKMFERFLCTRPKGANLYKNLDLQYEKENFMNTSYVTMGSNLRGADFPICVELWHRFPNLC